MAFPLRDDGTVACCGGFGGEHMVWCEVGAEIARLHRVSDMRAVLRERAPEHPAVESFDVLAEVCGRRLVGTRLG